MEGESEFWLGRERIPFILEDHSDLTVAVAEAKHVEAIAEFQALAFDNPIEQSFRYAKKSVEDENCLLYLVLKENRVIASCTIDISSDTNYLFGLAVADGFRGKGMGTYLVQSLINERIREDNRPFQIAVESDNPRARKLYERLGFEEQTEVLYLKAKLFIKS